MERKKEYDSMNRIGDLKTFLQALKERDLLFTTERK